MANDLNSKLNNLFPSLVQARRDMSLFQHHDGVTGTSTPHVMLDYEARMIQGINSTKAVIAEATIKITGIKDLHVVEASNRLNVTVESVTSDKQ
jgi:hypothetical protein